MAVCCLDGMKAFNLKCYNCIPEEVLFNSHFWHLNRSMRMADIQANLERIRLITAENVSNLIVVSNSVHSYSHMHVNYVTLGVHNKCCDTIPVTWGCDRLRIWHTGPNIRNSMHSSAHKHESVGAT